VLRKIGAEAWFDRHGADRFLVREQTVRIGNEETISLVVIDEDRMLEER
jgi:hypothetical protein